VSDASNAGNPPVSRGLLITLGVLVAVVAVYLGWIWVVQPLLTADEEPDEVEFADDDPAADDPDDPGDPDDADEPAADADEPDPAQVEDPVVVRGARDPFDPLVTADGDADGDGDGDGGDGVDADDDAATDDDADGDDGDDADPWEPDDDAYADFDGHTIHLVDIGKDGSGSLEAVVEVDGDRETASAGDYLGDGDLTLWSLDEACALVGDDDEAVEVCVDASSGK